MVKRRRLTRQKVVQSAVTLANESGRPEAVTLTAVAQAVGVRPPSLYNHIDGQEDLATAMAVYGSRQLLEQVRAAAVGRTGIEAMRAIAHAYRRFAHDNPGLYPLTLRAPDPHDTELVALSQKMLQLLTRLLAGMGLHGDDGLHAIRGLRSILHGFVALEVGDGFKMPLDLDESFERLVRVHLAGLQTNDG